MSSPEFNVGRVLSSSLVLLPLVVLFYGAVVSLAPEIEPIAAAAILIISTALGLQAKATKNLPFLLSASLVWGFSLFVFVKILILSKPVPFSTIDYVAFAVLIFFLSLAAFEETPLKKLAAFGVGAWFGISAYLTGIQDLFSEITLSDVILYAAAAVIGFVLIDILITFTSSGVRKLEQVVAR